MILCSASILAIVPLARTIQRFVTNTVGRSAFGYFVLVGVAFFLIFMVWLLAFRLRVRHVTSYLCLAMVGFIYIYFTLKLWAHPEEAVHFLEYGLLSYLLFQALRHHYDDIAIYFSAFFLGSFIGIIDEIFQWITPQRYWDFRDVGLNALAVLLLQIALAFGVRPQGLSPSVTPRSLRFASTGLVINLILLGLCFSNTPQRVTQYTRLIPQLSFLQKEEIMHDFKKKKHVLPGIGTFISAMRLEEIQEIDLTRGQELGAILHDWKDKPYEEFLQHFSASKEPFLHEFRVRVFRRDQKLKEASKLPPGPKREKALLSSFRENLFLENYFRQTLSSSGYAWAPDFTSSLASEVNPEANYRSPVGAGFMLFQKENLLWSLILALLGILILVNIYYHFYYQKKKKKKNQPAGGIEPSTC